MRRFSYSWGGRCDALTKSRYRCKNPAITLIPNCLDGNGSLGHKKEMVGLCRVHEQAFRVAVKNERRLAIRFGGWLGAYNSHKYGSLVFDRAKVDWGITQFANKRWAEMPRTKR